MIIDGQKNYKKIRVRNHLWILTWYINLIITQLKYEWFYDYILVLASLTDQS